MPEVKLPDGVRVTRWDGDLPPVTTDIYARLGSEGVPHMLRNDPVVSPATRGSHPYPVLLWVISGWLSFTFPGRDSAAGKRVVLSAGDRIEVRADVAYEQVVVGSAPAVYLSGLAFALPPAPHPAGIDI